MMGSWLMTERYVCGICPQALLMLSAVARTDGQLGWTKLVSLLRGVGTGKFTEQLLTLQDHSLAGGERLLLLLLLLPLLTI